MKSLCNILMFLLAALRVFGQNIEFDKANFPDDKSGLKEALKAIDDGDEIYNDAMSMGGPSLTLLQDAIPFYLAADRFNPNNAELNFKLANCYMHSNYKFKSLDHFKKAYEINPSITKDIHYMLARGYHLDHDFDNAIIEYEMHRKTLTSREDVPLILEMNKHMEECETGKRLVASPIRVWIDNLGKNINSPSGDYSPLISADESLIIFTSRRLENMGGKKDEFDHKYYEDVYFSEKVNGEWSAAQNIGDAINSDNHDATAGVSADGRTLYAYYGNKGGGDIYVSKQKQGEWSKAKSVGKTINTKSHESSACLSSDEKQLYFVSDKPEDNFGLHDIFVCDWDAEAQDWGPARNLGPVINTKHDERGVFMHPDGKTLYFSSTGHNTMGGLDIFSAVLNENGGWSEPRNIGFPVNTPDDDVFFVVSASGQHAYYASFKKGGFGEKDIYMITFLGPEKPPMLNTEDNLMASIAAPIKEKVIEPIVAVNTSNLAILKGTIFDAKSMDQLEAEIELTDNETHELVATFSSDAKTGKYLITLPAGKNYGIAVKAASYLFHSENFIIPDTAAYREYVKDIGLLGIEVGNFIILKNIFFDTDKYELRPESKTELARLTNLMNENPTLKIEISGHTDSQGSDEYNVTLSQNRSNSVVTYLINKGIAKNRLTFKGYGETTPIATNETAEGRQLNRRTEFKILSK